MLLGLLIGTWSMVYTQPRPVLLDPAKAKDTTRSGIFDETEFIPLETSHQSIFGIIKQLVVTDKYFIILDTDTDAILFFDKQGKFITKYKNAPKRYRIHFIQQDKSRNALLIFSQHKNYNLTLTKLQAHLAKDQGSKPSTLVSATRLYLNDLPALRTEIVPAPAYLLANPVSLGSRKFIFSFIRSDAQNTEMQDHELKVMNEDSVVREYFPYHTKTDSVFYGRTAHQCSFFPTLNDSVLFISRPFQPFIYRLTPDSIAAMYEIAGSKMRPAASMPNAFSFAPVDQISFGSITISTRAGSGGSLLGSNMNTVNNFANLERFLFFNVRQPFGNYNYYVFDKKENRLYDRSKLKADSSSFLFPLQGPVLAFDEKNIYQGLSARALFNLKKGAAKMNPQYEKTLARFYKTGKPADNPVILRLKPKED
ncbi:hypothetical protein SAMN04487894_102195 [Niabella drilacis]|uniref:6-bladed beta-propeller protein n=2 Tax=Niabella drilacis (strain DSM 25811 / CCM 8410 / CCUG 62505 / LMG 26954 / E90) TaxID=1285928 RepID=A0A1G6L301_NIADE|nr:hypothetical protein SAMN04487894_102195 [Niabella drilacis]